jgi:broad specificity phosphatase PhoE
MLRTEQTFFLIYGCKEHQVLPELREYHFGEFEMKTHDQLSENELIRNGLVTRKDRPPAPTEKAQ